MPAKILQINFKFRASTADYQNLCQSESRVFQAGVILTNHRGNRVCRSVATF